MSWFARKNKPVIPPVEPPSSGNPPPASAPPSTYRSTSSTYIASRDGDLSDPRSYSNLPSGYGQRNNSYGANQGDRNGDGGRPDYARQGSSYGDSAPSQTYGNQSHRTGYGAKSSVSDPYARGERNIDLDRNALFADAAPPEESQGRYRFQDGLAGPPPEPTGNEDEDVEAIKTQTRFLKQDTVASTRNALRMAREAEESGRATLLKLGEQSERIANTERNIDVSKGHTIRADDNATDINKLNRSIFIPAITFNKEKKRLAQEQKREQRYRSEMTEREVAMMDVRDSQNRLGRAATYGRNDGAEGDDEAIGGGYRRQRTMAEENLRKEQRKRYQFEADEEDDEAEDEIDNNVDDLTDVTKRLQTLGLAMGSELQTQNERLTRLGDKTDRLNMRIDMGTAKLNKISR